MDIRSICPIKTVDNTSIEMELAGIGPRLVAAVTDMVVMMLLLVSILFGLFFIKNYAPQLAETVYNLFFPRGTMSVPPVVIAVVALGGSYVFGFIYYFLSEWRWNGQTVGKFLLNIRVVRQDGQPIGFWEAFGRNLLRFFLDVYPLGFGVYPLMMSRYERRFGDFLVGTIVINDAKVRRPHVALREDYREGPGGALLLEPEEMAAVSGLEYVGLRLLPADYDWIQQFLGRAEEMDPRAFRGLLGEAAGYFRHKLNLPVPQPVTEGEDLLLLKRLRALYTHSALSAGG